jgi:hypothetical protein
MIRNLFAAMIASAASIVSDWPSSDSRPVKVTKVDDLPNHIPVPQFKRSKQQRRAARGRKGR